MDDSPVKIFGLWEIFRDNTLTEIFRDNTLT
jgi:hypothetical protein